MLKLYDNLKMFPQYIKNQKIIFLKHLITSSPTSACIFEVQGLSDEQIAYINEIETKNKIKERMRLVFSQASDVYFVGMANSVFNRNLMLIDSRMPELVAHAVLCHYRDDIASCFEIVNKLEKDNPMNFPTKDFYSYKFKKLLCAAALGMTPGREWDGIDEANGGYIIVTSGGDVLAYHIYNRNYFESYLLNQTKFERGSTGRHEYASLYKNGNRTFVNLNLQIRFVR